MNIQIEDMVWKGDMVQKAEVVQEADPHNISRDIPGGGDKVERPADGRSWIKAG